MTNFLSSLGLFCVRHQRVVTIAWVLAIVLAVAIGGTSGGTFSENFRVPGTESERALDVLADQLPDYASGSALVVFQVKDGTLRNPDTRIAVESVLDRVRTLEDVRQVGDPFLGQDAALTSNETVGYARVQYQVELQELEKSHLVALKQVVEEVGSADITVAVGGELASFIEDNETGGPEVIGLLAAVVILLLAFGSVLAMGLPIGLAVSGIAISVSLIQLLAAAFDVSSVSIIVGAMIGLGVGIDYALLVVTRHRQYLRNGLSVEAAAARANATAGQSVVIAGGTVIIAIGGLAVVGIPLVTMVGVSVAMVVATMVLASVTLLPALLGIVGLTIDRFGIPGVRPQTEAGDSSRWASWGRSVARRPWPFLTAAVILLAVLASPVLSMRLAIPDASNRPRGSTERLAFELLAEGFGPGVNGPLFIVTTLPPDAPIDDTLADLSSNVAADPDVAQVSTPILNQTRTTAIFQVIPRSGPQDEETFDLVRRLRTSILPSTLASVGGEGMIGGLTATLIDLTDRVSDRLPWFMGTIIGLSYLLLMVVFRSVLVPLKAALMNLISIGAAYGVIVATFQWGWGTSLLGIDAAVPMVSFLPMFLFAILFGLSMDYEIFLLSRVREEHLRGYNTTDSIVRGLASTGRIITSAAAIMVVVFSSFTFIDNIVVKQLGLGLATAILVDATIVRIILVPATMVLLGQANWWLPRWLERFLPRVDAESEPVPHPEHVPSGTGR